MKTCDEEVIKKNSDRIPSHVPFDKQWINTPLSQAR